jgi:hypothetical protein
MGRLQFRLRRGNPVRELIQMRRLNAVASMRGGAPCCLAFIE